MDTRKETSDNRVKEVSVIVKKHSQRKVLLVVLSVLLLIALGLNVWQFASNGNKETVNCNVVVPELEYYGNASDSSNDVNITAILSEELARFNESEDLLQILAGELIWSIINDESVVVNYDDGSDDSDGNNRRRLQTFGPFGGGGGSPFTLSSGGSKITKICVWTGSLLDAIQVFFANGAISSKVGGGGGSQNCYVSPTACFTGISGRSGSVIDGIQFVSSNGDLSTYFGGGGGSAFVSNFQPHCLTQISGRSGSLIDQLSFTI